MTRRASRTLMRVLSVTTVVGLGAYGFSHYKHSDPGEAATGAKPKTVTLLAVDDSSAKTKVEDKADLKPAVVPTDSKAEVKPETPPAKLGNVVVPPVNKNALVDGKAKIDAGELLAGRKLLNDALMGGQFTGADAVAARQLIGEANKFIVFSPRRFSEDPWASTYAVATGDKLTKIALKYNLTPELLLQMNGLTDARKLRAGASIKVLQGPFHVVVSKQAFTLDLYLGSPGEKNAQFITSFPVGLGKDDSTPTGTWIVEQRIPNPKWWGARGLPPIEPGDPKNPLGKFWISLAGVDGKAEGQQSYGIHGTIEPESIGKQASMGCIRLRNEDVAVVYTLLVNGKSTVVVKD